MENVIILTEWDNKMEKDKYLAAYEAIRAILDNTKERKALTNEEFNTMHKAMNICVSVLHYPK